MVVSKDILISEVSVFMDFAIVMCNALYFFVSIFGFINDINAFFRHPPDADILPYFSINLQCASGFPIGKNGAFLREFSTMEIIREF